MRVRVSSWSLEELARIVAGNLVGRRDRDPVGISTDTRDAQAGCLFIALVGERFDGHAFVEQSITNGACGVMVARTRVHANDVSRWEKNVAVILVDDPLVALGELAKEHRKSLQTATFFAVTGSNGKTTTKEMLASILRTRGPTHCTEGNLNNWIGVPFTLFQATREHANVVLEMGMNKRGEIARLTEISDPHVGVITNVSRAHIGELGSQEEVAEAKGELFFGMHTDAVRVVNLDDPWIVKLAHRTTVHRTRTFGVDPHADVRVVRRTPTDGGQRVVLSIDGREVSFEIPFFGAHNAMNAAAAVACATARAPVDEDLLGLAFSRAVHARGRLRVEHVKDIIVVDDTYNANTASIESAISVVSELRHGRAGRFVAILGEMRELGAFSEREHAQVGTAIGAAGCSLAVVFGQAAEPLFFAAKHAGVKDMLFEPSDVERAVAWLMPKITANDVVLVKGSRAMRMERFVVRIQEERR